MLSKPKRSPTEWEPSLADILTFHTLVTKAKADTGLDSWNKVAACFSDRSRASLGDARAWKVGSCHDMLGRLLRDYGGESVRGAKNVVKAIGKPTALTEVGIRLFELAEGFATVYTKHLPHLRKKHLRVAISDSAVHYLLPDLWRTIEANRREGPDGNVNVQFLRYDPRTIRTQLNRAELDVAIAWQVFRDGRPAEPNTDDGLEVEDLTPRPVPFAVLYHPAHQPWGADRKTILHLDELRGQRLYGSFTLDAIGDLAREGGVAELVEVSGTAAAIPFIRLNSGVGLFPAETTMLRAVQAIGALRVAKLESRYSLVLRAFRRLGTSTPPVTFFVNLFKDELKSSGEEVELRYVSSQFKGTTLKGNWHTYHVAPRSSDPPSSPQWVVGRTQLLVEEDGSGAGSVGGTYLIYQGDKKTVKHRYALSGRFTANQLALIGEERPPSRGNKGWISTIVTSLFTRRLDGPGGLPILLGAVNYHLADPRERPTTTLIVLSRDELEAVRLTRFAKHRPLNYLDGEWVFPSGPYFSGAQTSAGP